MMRRAGFALHVVLWVMVAAAAVSLAGAAIGRDEFDATRNRISLERAHWNATDCAERARAIIDAALAGAQSLDIAARAWRAIDKRLAESPLVQGRECTVSAEAAGTRADINSVPHEMLAVLLSFHGASDAAALAADSIVSRRSVRPFADVREAARLPEMNAIAGSEGDLSTEPGRISINNAREGVLAALPGFTGETVERIMTVRERGDQVTDLLELAGMISTASANALMSRIPWL